MNAPLNAAVQMSNADYHAHSAISSTQLSLFARDENGLEWAEACPVDDEKLKTLDFGDAMHSILLEPERLETDFAVMPELNLRTNKGKEEKAAFLEANKDKRILTADEHKKLSLMFGSVMAHPGARRLIKADGACESSWFWTDEDSGVACRCRPDKMLNGLPILVDVKTTDQLSKFHFSVEDYGYYRQAAFYLDGLRANGVQADHMVFLVIQKTIELGRYPVACYTLPTEAIEHGREEYKDLLSRYAVAQEREQLQIVTELPLSRRFMAKIEGGY